MSDPINPLYYQRNGIQTIDYMQSKMTASQFSGYCLGNVLKYVSRAGHKSSDSYKQDLRKALWYLQKLIEVEEQANDEAMQRRPTADSQRECGWRMKMEQALKTEAETPETLYWGKIAKALEHLAKCGDD